MTRFLTEKEIIFLNALLIEKYTPEEQKGVKFPELLNSAVNRPKQSAFGQDAYPTLWLKAAALYASLCQNHPFHNANKRTGFAAMKQFLWLNGYLLTAPEKEAEEYTVKVVTDKPSIEEIAMWIETWAKKR
ncbi:type II toxin-antitoxin system death-on-curing family toxin [Geobacillus stearothermophilus]|uniref:type II toxin-antitoxin system death-on-curing family toxin n=1 Tax=Geobacillus stearothermophilus TaxID=1422 RepID=UPI002E1C7E80|nr:type II toxin-antitoxin system death-on-curing family toxin [Geobacillus stearothermophilus]MED3751551.1 type II toxin-antitoxin system death-on-curing family toxin [Geobacillus stearothermophilus]MED3757080.1 type II toxin-antitoxin system death-on-curing family toxin [Geobacillus stearothermophilus]